MSEEELRAWARLWQYKNEGERLERGRADPPNRRLRRSSSSLQSPPIMPTGQQRPACSLRAPQLGRRPALQAASPRARLASGAPPATARSSTPDKGGGGGRPSLVARRRQCGPPADKGIRRLRAGERAEAAPHFWPHPRPTEAQAVRQGRGGWVGRGKGPVWQGTRRRRHRHHTPDTRHHTQQTTTQDTNPQASDDPYTHIGRLAELHAPLRTLLAASPSTPLQTHARRGPPARYSGRGGKIPISRVLCRLGQGGAAKQGGVGEKEGRRKQTQSEGERERAQRRERTGCVWFSPLPPCSTQPVATRRPSSPALAPYNRRLLSRRSIHSEPPAPTTRSRAGPTARASR